jgi:hypothetical protein
MLIGAGRELLDYQYPSTLVGLSAGRMQTGMASSLFDDL